MTTSGTAKGFDLTYLARCAGLALAYFLVAEASRALAIPPAQPATVWAPAGMAMAAMILWGARVWPGIWLGSAVTNYSLSGSLAIASVVGTGAVAAFFATLWVARRWMGPALEFRRPESVFAFAAVCAVFGVLASTLGVPVHFLYGRFAVGALSLNWYTWALSGAIGMLLVTPLLLAWLRGPDGEVRARWGEVALFAALLGLTLAFMFGVLPLPAYLRDPGPFLLVPFMVWAGCRFGARAITAFALLISLTAISATAAGLGPFATEDPAGSLVLLQVFAGTLALVGLALRALTRQRDDPGIRLLRLREAQLAEAQAIAHIGSWERDPVTDRVVWSAELYRIFGLQPGQFDGSYLDFLARVHPDDRESVRAAGRSGKSYEQDYRIVLPDGRTRAVHSRAQVEPGPDGKPQRVLGTVQDVTERKDIEAALRASEQRFRAIAENATDMIGLLDPLGRRIYMNPAYDRLLGDSRAYLGSDAFALVHPDDRERVKAVFHEQLRSRVPQRADYRWVLADGSVRYIEGQSSAIPRGDGGVALVVIVSRDVTERRAAEEALRAREAQLQQAHELAKIGSWTWDVRANVVTWSTELREMLGVDEHHPSSVEGFHALVHPDDVPGLEAAAQSWIAAAAGGPEQGKPYPKPYRIVRPDGTVRVLFTSGRAETDAAGHPVRMVGVCQDVTDRVSMEEQARASEERFRMMVENVRDYAFVLLNGEGRIATWNAGAERINGYAADEIVGAHFERLYPEDERRGLRDALDVAASAGRYEAEGWHVRKDGSRFWAHVVISPVRAHDGDRRGELRGFSKITHDITERKRAEEDLRSYADRLVFTSRRLLEIQESERRTLARELHDRVGPNLTALGINLRLIAATLPRKAPPKVQTTLRDSGTLIEETIVAMRDVMGELRPQALDDYGMLAALRGLANGFARRTGIEVKVSGQGKEGPAGRTVDLAMFRIAQEALNNVAKHARAGHVELRYSQLNGHTRLEIEDDGIGFEPRHGGSTLESGWGLLIMRERAEAAGARFSLDSAPGRGVRLRVEHGR